MKGSWSSLAIVISVAWSVVTPACKSKDAADDYIRRSKAVEGKLYLKQIAQRAKTDFEYNGTLPGGTVGPTPATSCCTHPKGVCPPEAATWSDPLWQRLDFMVTEPYRFQYSYTSDGTTFTATATADASCDGNLTTYTVAGRIEGDRVVVDDSQITSPRRAR